MLGKNAYLCREPEPGKFRVNIHRCESAGLIISTEEEQWIAIKAARYVDMKVAGVDIIGSFKGPLLSEVNSLPGLEGAEGVVAKILRV